MPLSPDDPIALGVSSTGTVLVVLMLLAQLPAMWRVIRVSKSVAGMAASPSAGMSANCFAWTCYGLLQGDPAVIRVNLIGTCFGAFYLGIFLFYSRAAQAVEIRKLVATLVLGMGSLELLIIFLLAGDARISALGTVAVLCNVVMYAAPITAIRDALQKMDTSNLPVLLILANTACGACWTAYGLLVDNMFIAGPNIAGSVLNVAQLAAYVYIRVKGPPKGEWRYATLDTPTDAGALDGKI